MCAKEFEAHRPHARYCSDTCRKRARRAGAAAPTDKPVVPVRSDGPSGSAARAWLNELNLSAETSPAAADLLVVADAIDTVTVAGQVQFVAALARQAAALRAELRPRTPEDPEQPDGGQEGPGGGSSGDGGPERRTFDAAAL